MKCLRCEIGELMMRRQAQGERLGKQQIGEICQVIADIAASRQHMVDQSEVFGWAAEQLSQFMIEVAAGIYGAEGESHNPDHQRREVN